MSVAERIKEARKNAGITQKELGRRMGVSDASIAQYESGERNPKMKTLKRIGDALGAPLFYFLGYSEYDPKSWADINSSRQVYDGITIILASIYGDFEAREVRSSMGGDISTIIIVGKNDNAFVLSHDDIRALCDSVREMLPPIVDRLKDNRTVDEVIAQTIKDMDTWLDTFLDEEPERRANFERHMKKRSMPKKDGEANAEED